MPRPSRGSVPATPPPPKLTSQRARARRAGERERTRRQRAILRHRILAFGLLALLVAAVGLIAALASGGPVHRRTASVTSSHGTQQPAHAQQPARAEQPSSFAVGLRVLRLVDTTRTVQFPDGSSEPRTLLTYVRYPALGAPSRTDVPNAPAARADGPYPLVIFGHGFGVTPQLYARLLQAW